MATDDERRRVAAALRGYVRRYEAPTWKALCNIVLGREEGARDLRKIHTLDRLADLIDPTCLACPDVEDTPDGGQFDCWSCSVCGNILSSDPDYDTDTDGPTYCEVCGHRIIGKGEPTWL